jgi:hypothetical protein
MQMMKDAAPAAPPGPVSEIRLPISQLLALAAIVAAAVAGAERVAASQRAAL